MQKIKNKMLIIAKHFKMINLIICVQILKSIKIHLIILKKYQILDKK